MVTCGVLALAAAGVTPAAATPWDAKVHYWGGTDCWHHLPPAGAASIDVSGTPQEPVKLSLQGFQYDVTFTNVPESGVTVTFTVHCAATSYTVRHKVDRPWWIGTDVYYNIPEGGD